MSDNNQDELDFSIGGVPIGKHMKSSSRMMVITTVAAIVSAIAGIVSVVILLTD
jgi:hypothetical protein